MLARKKRGSVTVGGGTLTTVNKTKLYIPRHTVAVIPRHTVAVSHRTATSTPALSIGICQVMHKRVLRVPDTVTATDY